MTSVQRAKGMAVVLAMIAGGWLTSGAMLAAGQATAPKPGTPGAQKPAVPAPTAAKPDEGVKVPSDYLIGVDDILYVELYKDKDNTGDVVVRPDGKISFRLVNDVPAAGLTVEQFRESLTKAFAKFNDDPTVIVMVKQINSRNVFICCNVGKAGKYPLTEHMTVANLISAAGGLNDFAKKDSIRVVRVVNGQQVPVARLNWDDFAEGKPAALKQNIELRPGDQVIVP